MMNRSLVLILALAAGAAAAQVQTSWVNYPGGVSVARDAADNVYTATWDYNPAGDIYIAKRNPAGALLWEVRHDNTDTTRHEVATWVGTDSAGNVWVSGTSRSGYSSPVNASSLLMKYSPDGQQLWRRVYGSDFDGSSTRRFVMDPQDRAYVVGLGVCPAGMMSTVRQFNADGSAGWIWCDAAGIGAPVMIKRTPDQQFLISARGIFGSVNGYAKVDAAGNTVWSLPGVTSLTVGDSAGDAAGNTYLVNGNYTTGQGSVLQKRSPTGALLWEREHPIAAFRVEVGPDGNPVLSGFPNTNTAGAAFAKFSSAGALLWTNLDADGPAVGLLLHSQMLVDAAGSAYVSGSTLFEMGVTKVLADGTSAWTALAPGSNTTAMAFGSQGQVYVTGGQTARLDQGPVAPTVDLALTLSDAPDPVKVGATLVYTATVVNGGNSPAPAVAYTQALPRSLTWLGATPSQGSCTGGRTVSCSLGTLPAGASATISVMVQPKLRGTLTGSASVGSSAVDINPGDNSATTTTTVRR
jgi:uncharacterized repeat protein (TIGR01451 family)